MPSAPHGTRMTFPVASAFSPAGFTHPDYDFAGRAAFQRRVWGLLLKVEWGGGGGCKGQKLVRLCVMFMFIKSPIFTSCILC